MKIVPNQDFKHERYTFRKGHAYDVPESDAEYFQSVGWVGKIVELQSQDLEIQDGQIGHESEVN